MRVGRKSLLSYRNLDTNTQGNVLLDENNNNKLYEFYNNNDNWLNVKKNAGAIATFVIIRFKLRFVTFSGKFSISPDVARHIATVIGP